MTTAKKPYKIGMLCPGCAEASGESFDANWYLELHARGGVLGDKRHFRRGDCIELALGCDDRAKTVRVVECEDDADVTLERLRAVVKEHMDREHPGA
jgi:hypothetical protein